jgi:hypothetical protein
MYHGQRIRSILGILGTFERFFLKKYRGERWETKTEKEKETYTVL